MFLEKYYHMQKSIRLAVLIASLAIAGNAFSQPGSPSGPPCGGPFGPACPIDGGVSLLIAAGLAYGGKKSFDLTRKKG